MNEEKEQISGVTTALIVIFFGLLMVGGILGLFRSGMGCWLWQTTEWEEEYNPIPDYSCEELEEIISLELYDNVRINSTVRFCETDGSVAQRYTNEYFYLSDFKELYKDECLNLEEKE